MNPGVSSGSPRWALGSKKANHFLLLFQALQQQTGLEVEQPEFELGPIHDAGIADSGLCHYATLPVLAIKFHFLETCLIYVKILIF